MGIQMIMGRIIWTKSIISRVGTAPWVGAMSENMLIWPTRPLVPMPAPAGMLVMRKICELTAPVIALAAVGAIQIRGLRMILGT